MSDIVDLYLFDLKSKFKKINPQEYYLSYSGGKDSHLLYWFIKEYAKIDGIKIIGVNTYMEHPQIRKRLYDNCDKVLLPELKPFEIKEKYGSPCFSKLQDYYIYLYQKGNRNEPLMRAINGDDFIGTDGKKHSSRYKLNKKAKELLLNNNLHKISNKCCMYLKKKPMEKFRRETKLKAILGVRSAEGMLRKSRYTSCFKKDGTFTPLWDLTDEMEEKIYKKYNIEIPEIYNYVTRTGCMGCPYGHYRGTTEKELELLNKSQHDFVCEYFKESYSVLGINTNYQERFF